MMKIMFVLNKKLTVMEISSVSYDESSQTMFASTTKATFQIRNVPASVATESLHSLMSEGSCDLHDYSAI